MEHGSWQPECYLTVPPKRGHVGRGVIPDGYDHAIVVATVIRPAHVWRCPCECHTTAARIPAGAQLPLFEAV